MTRTRPLLLLLALSGCGAPEFRERLLAVLPEDVRVTVPVAFTTDGRQAAWVERTDGACRAVRGAWRSHEFPVIC
jgi:hypothetical protein